MKNVLLILLCSFFLSANATHLRCGHISLRNISGLTYEVSVIVYTNTGSAIQFGDGALSFGDGTTQITPTTPNTYITAYPNLGQVSYTVNHTFPATGNYTITYTELNLTGGIVNIINSVETPFYLEASIVLGETTPYASPSFLALPIFRFAPGKPFSLSHIVVDPNDYQLRYQLVSPLNATNPNFTMPDNLKVNPFNGEVTWDATFKGILRVGEFLFAVKILQFDKNGKKMGELIRTFQVVLEDIDADIKINNPVKDVNGKVFVAQEQKRVIKVSAEQNANPITWQAYYDKNISSANISFTQYDSSANSKVYKVGALTLAATSGILRDNPYMITLRAESFSSYATIYRDLSFLFYTKDINPTEVIPTKEVPTQEVVTAVESGSGNALKVYPNPFHSLITIKSELADKSTHVEIMDLTGRQIHQSSFTGSTELDASWLPSGLYIIRLKNNEAYSYLKVMKE